MILIPCTIKCDYYTCTATAEAQMQFMGTNVPTYCNQWQIVNPPEGWDIQNNITGDVLRKHFCPTHFPKSKKVEPFAFSNIGGSKTNTSPTSPEKYEDVHGPSETYDKDGWLYPEGNYPRR